MKTLIEHVVGYMLKVIKSGINIKKNTKEFNAIKHGDYKCFMKLIRTPIPFMVKYVSGKITAEENNPNYDCDFEGLLKSGSALKLFYKKCFNHYGNIIDSDISDDNFAKLVTFEIAIRMHANNNLLLNKSVRTDLVDIIPILCKHKNIPLNEAEILQKGRIFLNMVKHNKAQFSSWQIGIENFEKSYHILEKYSILIV